MVEDKPEITQKAILNTDIKHFKHSLKVPDYQVLDAKIEMETWSIEYFFIFLNFFSIWCEKSYR